ncbi:cdc42 effector protein 5 [Alosa alosa]|uniref:cdc42 effector protein 5 n=1 Tax=Alosa alosa TaxID=278164 RepID=UPI00201512BE|nr:cdc42 effector protein 5 [Alosa alosa]
MPLHKSSRGRLDPTMISAPLGDFRHTMHIGRGGDAFGDTSFLATQGSSSADSSNSAPGSTEPTDSEAFLNHDSSDGNFNTPDSSKLNELQHSESVSSFDLDLDLGPSILGDVLGVMDGLSLDSNWTTDKDAEEKEVFSPSRGTLEMEMPVEDSTVSSKNEVNEKKRMEGANGEENGERGLDQLSDGNGWKAKGLKPKVRFSEKREEIVDQLVKGDSQGVEGEETECPSPTEVEPEIAAMVSGEVEPANHRADSPPSSTSSLSSEYEGVAPLDRRRESEQHSETDSEEEGGVDGQRGYTFEDEFDDEIGL